MAYSDVKTTFQAILNRRDITSTLVNTFMGFAIQRIHQEIRVPAMEKLVTLTTDGTSRLNVPGDLLEVISVHVNDASNGRTKLTRTDLPTILTYAADQGQPIYYHREVGYLYLGPFPPTAQSVFVHYFADSTSLTADTDVNWLTEVAPTLLIYAALTFAADYYIDDRIKLFEDRYVQIRDGLNYMAQQDEVVNASIRPTFTVD